MLNEVRSSILVAIISHLPKVCESGSTSVAIKTGVFAGMKGSIPNACIILERNPMKFDEYQYFTSTTAKYPPEMGIYYTALGLAGEAGEYCDKIKKVLRDDDGEITPEKRVELIKELGDIQWYISEAARMLNYSLSEVAKINVDKLTSRAERGKLHGSGDNR